MGGFAWATYLGTLYMDGIRWCFELYEIDSLGISRGTGNFRTLTRTVVVGTYTYTTQHSCRRY